MPVWVDPEKCNGCFGSSQPPCLRMCPGDLIVKDFAADKAYLKYPEDCWDCLPCVKVCPEEAIHVGVHYENAEYSRDRFVYDLERLCAQTHPVSTLWDPADPKGE